MRSADQQAYQCVGHQCKGRALLRGGCPATSRAEQRAEGGGAEQQAEQCNGMEPCCPVINRAAVRGGGTLLAGSCDEATGRQGAKHGPDEWVWCALMEVACILVSELCKAMV